MDFLELAQRRCSIRAFADIPIEEEKLEYMLEAGRVAPTACNKQPQRIIVVQDPVNILKVQKACKTFGSRNAVDYHYPCVLRAPIGSIVLKNICYY